MQGSIELPSYSIRKSKRAKNPQMTYTSEKGLVVVVPYNMQFDTDNFVRENKNWILKQIKNTPQKAPFSYPRLIELKCINTTFNIEYMTSQARCKLIERAGNSLVVMGRTTEVTFKRVIYKWLIQKAKSILKEMLDDLSIQCGLPYQDLLVRNQTTIWGSCSHDGIISLNYKLIFLPKELARYVIIHELAHTIYLNHGKSFWKLVAKFDSNYRTHIKSLQVYQTKFPNWI